MTWLVVGQIFGALSRYRGKKGSTVGNLLICVIIFDGRIIVGRLFLFSC